MARGLADLFDVVGADALLHARRARVRRGHEPGEVRHERHHAGDREEQGRVVADTSEAEGTTVWPRVGEEVEPAPADVCGLHGSVLVRLPGCERAESDAGRQREAARRRPRRAQLGLALVVALGDGLAERRVALASTDEKNSRPCWVLLTWCATTNPAATPTANHTMLFTKCSL